MTRDAGGEAAQTAREVLWFWIDEADDPDLEQRGWKRSRLEGILLACERTGVLTTEEIARWRGLASGGAPAPPVNAEGEAVADFLDGLLRCMRPLTRDEDPDRLRASRRFHGALGALAAAGVIDDSERSSWHERALSSEAPWLSADNVQQLAVSSGFFAIGVPASTPEEEAADAAARLEHEKLVLRGALRRVAVATPPGRQDGLAVFGAVVCSECTELLFHFVGPAHGESSHGFADLDAHRALTDALVPPDLTDDAGTRYEPVSPRPVSSYGAGGLPDPERPRVITGIWRYHPAAPEAAGSFVATLGGARWIV